MSQYADLQAARRLKRRWRTLSSCLSMIIPRKAKKYLLGFQVQIMHKGKQPLSKRSIRERDFGSSNLCNSKHGPTKMRTHSFALVFQVLVKLTSLVRPSNTCRVRSKKNALWQFATSTAITKIDKRKIYNPLLLVYSSSLSGI